VLWSPCLHHTAVCSVLDRNVFEMTEKNCHFDQNVWKYRLMNTCTASFDTTVRQMTEMSQWPKCHSKKWPKCLSDKHHRPTDRTIHWTVGVGKFLNMIKRVRTMYILWNFITGNFPPFLAIEYSFVTCSKRSSCFYFHRAALSNERHHLQTAHQMITVRWI